VFEADAEGFAPAVFVCSVALPRAGTAKTSAAAQQKIQTRITPPTDWPCFICAGLIMQDGALGLRAPFVALSGTVHSRHAERLLRGSA
jgi:hypothetical protein